MADLSTNLSGSNPQTRSGWPRRRRRTRNTTCAARLRPGGGAWSGKPWADPHVVNVNGPRYGAIYGADRRLLGLNNIELITDRPLADQPGRDQAVKRDYPDRGDVVSADGALRGRTVEIYPAAGRRHRRGRGRAELWLPARDVRTRHGVSRGAGAGIHRNGHALVQGEHADAGDRETDAEHHRCAQTGQAALAGGRMRSALINTINSITSCESGPVAPEPTIDGKGAHGGYCGPAVKPIALNMVAEIARDAELRGLPIQRHWRR